MSAGIRGVSPWPRRLLRAVGLQVVILALTLAASEFILRVADLRYLRLDQSERSLLYAHDPQLGWSPVPNSAAKFTATRTITVQHNSLGLRDVEPDGAPKPTVMFVGDSFVWGYDVEADERFTEVIRQSLPGHRIVNAGVSGYGTDQEYLLLRRLWDRIKPDVVVLIYFQNDRFDNATNARYYGAFKPYFQVSPQGGEFRGQPVPHSRHYIFKNHWLTRNSLLARLAVSAYVPLRHPAVSVPDPTEHLVGMMRDFVAAHGAKFLVGVLDEPRIIGLLQTQQIPYVVLDDPPDRLDLRYIDAANHQRGHWTPRGHARAAGDLMRLLAETGVIEHVPVARAQGR
jgi:hypothetical protein